MNYNFCCNKVVKILANISKRIDLIYILSNIFYKKFDVAKLDLHKIRKEFGVTQRALSAMIGYPQSYISYVERGRADASKAFMEKLSKTLKIPDIERYMVNEDSQSGLQATVEMHIVTINKLLTMLEDKDRRIKELEDEIADLRVRSSSKRKKS